MQLFHDRFALALVELAQRVGGDLEGLAVAGEGDVGAGGVGDVVRFVIEWD
ncbi:hypothetical protein F4561_003652 [Lipingzhangella halophila]|uniref:Uncharacterized protein n=1 Tax=Lipingzhangella halophila TaxID=1783352 RepID=A0A7W7W3A1_9ACTN|nr:hypothetical protein [Lipingzhangella halophila]MBB4932832.1 hypothetical protein [Lipingzhangella halophila]